MDLRATPPSPETVARWVAAFGALPMRNLSGGSYRALGPEKEGWGDAAWTAAFAADPMLLKRPILEVDGRPALVGWTLPEEEIARRLGLG